jgi:hypothetical protein
MTDGTPASAPYHAALPLSTEPFPEPAPQNATPAR